MIPLLTQYIGAFMHAGTIAVLVLCGLGLPVPEDVVLVLAGAAVAAADGWLPSMILAAFVGVMAGDLITFSIGRRLGQSVAATRGFAWMFTERRLRRVRAYFRKYGDRTILLARFVTGFRALVFLTAGSIGVAPRRFVAINFLGAAISVPLEVTLGYFFARRLPDLLRALELYRLGVLGLVIVVGAAVGFWLWRRRGRGDR